MNMRKNEERPEAVDPRTVLHWFDLLCPFCYAGQQRNQILNGTDSVLFICRSRYTLRFHLGESKQGHVKARCTRRSSGRPPRQACR